jgi:polar amino acid transport system substrate-binding protein
MSRSTIAATVTAAMLLVVGATAASAQSPAAGPDELARIKAAGSIRINTDPNYAPQSMQKSDGTFEGFDIDVANEIGKRLGVNVEFTILPFDSVVAGGWNDRYDMSVGSVTITTVRKGVLDFTQPYYYTPAQMSATQSSGITTIDGLAGKAICVGAGTTYLDWLNGALHLADAPPPSTPPAGATAYVLPTDQECAQSVQSGRSDFDGWLTSSTTLDQAAKAGTQVVLVGDPVFYESLGVAFDNTVPDRASLRDAVDKIVGDMHADGTLSAFSQKWFGLDLTKTAGSAASPGTSAAPAGSAAGG